MHAVALDEALESEVIFEAIPFTAVAKFGQTVPDWSGKTVVNTTNAHYTPDADQILQGLQPPQYVAQSLPGAQIVKAFNQLPASVLAAEVDAALGKRVVFVAADSSQASERIAELVSALGLAAVQLGRIDEGGRLIEAPNALVLRNLIEQPLS